jgi:ankyrin repeat protein
MFGCCLVLGIVGISLSNGDDQLVRAVKQEDRSTVEKLIAEKIDVNAMLPDGATALHWATYRDDFETAKLLIEAGADVSAKNDLGVTPLSLACLNGSRRMVKQLLEAGAYPNQTLATGETVLMTAARTGKPEAVRALLAAGADVNAMEPERKQNALMWAISQKHSEVARLLLEHDAEVDAKSKSGSTPLHFAAREGDFESAQILVKAGADVNAKDRMKVGPLLTATVRGHVDLAIFLLEQGADANADATGYTPLHWACGSWETEMTGPNGVITPDDHEWSAMRGVPKGKLKLVRALLKHGANPNALLTRQPPRSGYTVFTTRPKKCTPYALAAMAGEVELMQALVDGGADPLLLPEDKTTALMMAAGVSRGLAESRVSNERSLAAVKLAFQHGADVNAANKIGETALHGAARIRSDEIVQFLFDNGANVNVKNERGQSPLFIAERYFHPGSAPLVEQTSTGDLLRMLAVPNVVRKAVADWGDLPADVREQIAALVAQPVADIEASRSDDPTSRINENPVLPKSFSPSYRHKKK